MNTLWNVLHLTKIGYGYINNFSKQLEFFGDVSIGGFRAVSKIKGNVLLSVSEDLVGFDSSCPPCAGIR